uniref:ADP-ribosyl cyclase/cyclic ADP-ribose hydrolase n=1 Tax=Picea sitchensis TaxID=3332 RepID=B8LQ96_PICSI|nr:unknown [Picea sitchensis]
MFELAMAASSSIAAHYSYDVFINHRGPDVKKTFASHLYRDLSKYGLKVFLDDPEMQPGDSLIRQIEGAVGTASVHVAVFSSRYAESRWCLVELLLMLKSGKTIIPVFYDVKPADLRAGGKYAEELAKKGTCGGKRKRYDSDTIEEWRNALSHVAGISGFELEKCNG